MKNLNLNGRDLDGGDFVIIDGQFVWVRWNF